MNVFFVFYIFFFKTEEHTGNYPPPIYLGHAMDSCHPDSTFKGHEQTRSKLRYSDFNISTVKHLLVYGVILSPFLYHYWMTASSCQVEFAGGYYTKQKKQKNNFLNSLNHTT